MQTYTYVSTVRPYRPRERELTYRANEIICARRGSRRVQPTKLEKLVEKENSVAPRLDLLSRR